MNDADHAAQWQILEDRKFRLSLVQQRHIAGLSIEDVSQAMNYPIDAINEFEDDTKDTRMSTIRRYAAAVGAVYRHGISAIPAVPPAEKTSDE